MDQPHRILERMTSGTMLSADGKRKEKEKKGRWAVFALKTQQEEEA